MNAFDQEANNREHRLCIKRNLTAYRQRLVEIQETYEKAIAKGNQQMAKNYDAQIINLKTWIASYEAELKTLT